MIQALKRFLGLGSPEYPPGIPAISQRASRGNPVSEDHLRQLAATIDPEQVRTTAEACFRKGHFYCSETVVKTIRDTFELPVSDDIIAAASGFPMGMGGAGCSCGAVAGGIMALGLVFGRTQAKDKQVRQAMRLARELHDTFKAEHRSICCRVLTRELKIGSRQHIRRCIAFTGEVAATVAQIIIRELGRGNRNR